MHVTIFMIEAGIGSARRNSMAFKHQFMRSALAALLLGGLMQTPAQAANPENKDSSANGLKASSPSMQGAVSRDRSDEVFNQNRIAEVWLDIPASSWAPIDDVALAGCGPHPRSYHPGTVKIGGVEYPGAGVRAKGGCGSSRELDEKSAFKAHLSWDDPAVPGCPSIRTYMGLKKFTFNNQVEDASFTHERIGYDFFQKLGVPVPRVAPVRLYVNQQLWGLYLKRTMAVILVRRNVLKPSLIPMNATNPSWVTPRI
jgi:hypothetical protein